MKSDDVSFSIGGVWLDEVTFYSVSVGLSPFQSGVVKVRSGGVSFGIGKVLCNIIEYCEGIARCHVVAFNNMT